MTLRVEHLTRSIAGSTLFDDLSFSLEPGQTLAVTGASGSGKSSLLRCLAWLDPIDAGTLTLDDRSPTVWGASAWRAEVCYVAQTPPPLKGSARDFLQIVSQLGQQRARSRQDAALVARAWGISEAAWRRPFAELSGGERQRLMLAMALSHAPRLLLLDEPTSAVDAATVALIEASLEGLTKIWVTHDEAQARRVADQRLRLEREPHPAG